MKHQRSFLDILKISLSYKKDFIIVAIIMLIYSVFQLFKPYMMKLFIDDALLKNNFNLIWVLFFCFLFIRAGEAITGVLLDVNLVKMGCKVLLDFRGKYLSKILEKNLLFFTDNTPGSLLYILNDQMLVLFRAVSNFSIHFIVQAILGIGIVCICLTLNVKLTLIFIFSIPFYYFLAKYSIKKIKELNSEIFIKLQNIVSYLSEILDGAMTIKIFNKQKYVIQKMNEKTNEFNKIALKNTFVSALFSDLSSFFNYSISLFALCIGGVFYVNHSITIGELLAFNSYLAMAMGIVKRVGDMIGNIQKSVVTLEKLDDFEKTKLDDMLAGKKKSKTSNFETIELKNITFGYDKKENILDKLNLKIKKGEHIAITGPSGSGKSTLINVIIGALEPVGGEMFYNNINYKDINKDNLLSRFSIVNQNLFLFDDTILNNIAFSSKRNVDDFKKFSFLNTIFRKDIYDVLQIPVGINGKKLSGGQKQAVGIVRALIKEHDILILDEATSSVDIATEKIITDTVDSLLKDKSKTLIIISHRESTLKNVDKIFRIK